MLTIIIMIICVIIEIDTNPSLSLNFINLTKALARGSQKPQKFPKKPKKTRKVDGWGAFNRCIIWLAFSAFFGGFGKTVSNNSAINFAFLLEKHEIGPIYNRVFNFGKNHFSAFLAKTSKTPLFGRFFGDRKNPLFRGFWDLRSNGVF